jgi:UV DNA damage endonuclease
MFMNLGYACINITLADQGITANRSMIRRTFLNKGIQYASFLALQNVIALQKILEWNVAHGINVFRITSDLFPWASEYKLDKLPDYAEIRNILEQAGKLPVRVTTHPGPFNKI